MANGPTLKQINTQDQDLNRVQANTSSAFNLLSTQFFVPIASVVFYAGQPSVTGINGIVTPNDQENWLICNGRSLSQSQFQPLFSRIGTTYGSTAPGFFNLPKNSNFGVTGIVMIKSQ